MQGNNAKIFHAAVCTMHGEKRFTRADKGYF
jgi:hypothetical protein